MPGCITRSGNLKKDHVGLGLPGVWRFPGRGVRGRGVWEAWRPGGVASGRRGVWEVWHPGGVASGRRGIQGRDIRGRGIREVSRRRGVWGRGVRGVPLGVPSGRRSISPPEQGSSGSERRMLAGKAHGATGLDCGSVVAAASFRGAGAGGHLLCAERVIFPWEEQG